MAVVKYDRLADIELLRRRLETAEVTLAEHLLLGCAIPKLPKDDVDRALQTLRRRLQTGGHVTTYER